MYVYRLLLGDVGDNEVEMRSQLLAAYERMLKSSEVLAPEWLYSDNQAHKFTWRNIGDWVDGTVYFRNGDRCLSRVGPESKIVNFYGSGSYVAVLQGHTSRSYQTGTNPVFFDMEIADDGQITQVTPKEPPVDIELFPNAWYFLNADYLSFRDSGRFEADGLPKIEPIVELTEVTPGAVTRTELAQEFEEHLFWLAYKNGKLTFHEPASGELRREFDATEPAIYTVMIVAESGDARILVSQVVVVLIHDK